MLPAVIIAVVIVLVLAGAVFSHKQAQARRDALRALTASRGWSFQAARDSEHDERFRQFGVFCRGSGRYAYNTLIGRMEVRRRTVELKAGDYHYQTRSNKRTHHHHFSYLLTQLPVPTTAELAIRPEGMFDKLGAFFGFDDIDFESAEFSDKFHVKSSDKRFAYDVVHPRMMEFLLATRGPTLAISQGYACVTSGRVWKPGEFSDYVEWLRLFFDHWPPHVLADLKSRA